MKWWPSRPVPFAAEFSASHGVQPEKKSGVEVSYSHEENFQRNLVTVRTVTTSSFGTIGSYASLYRHQPAVRAVVDFLARNIAQLNPKVYERVSTTDRLEVADHPLARLLRRPNPATTRYRHQRDTVADLAIYDRAYWWKMRRGGALAVVRVPPTALTVTTDEDGRTIYRTSKGEVIPRRDLVIFSGYAPDGGEMGVSPLETLRRVLQEEAAAVAYREAMWVNSLKQGGWIKRPADAPEWSDEGRQRFREGVEAMLSGSNSGKFGVLEDGMDWDPATFTPPTDDYVAGRRLTYEEVATQFFGPIAGRAFSEATASGKAEDHRQMYQDVFGPWLRMLQDEIELQLLSEFDPLGTSSLYVEFNLAEKLKGSFEEQGKTLVTAVGVPYMTVNEGRARLNLPRIDEDYADLPVQPLNVLYGGQPAVTAPTADPGSPQVASAPSPAVKAPQPVLKAPEAALRRRDSAAKDHTDLFRRFFERQQKAVTSAKAVSDRERWDRELTADLYLLATQIARKNGQLAALQINGVYDEQRTLAYLAENARIAAEAINAHTFDLLDEAEDAEDVDHVFEVAKSSRAEQLGLGRATMLIAFARTEAAKHSSDVDGQERFKTWTVTSPRSRHPEMNGESVPVGEPFSNGLMWPGAAGAGADEVANCRCLLNIE